MVDCVPVACVGANKLGLVTVFNRAACALFGYQEAEEVMGKNVKILMPPEIAAKHDSFIASAQDGTGSMFDRLQKQTAVRGDGSRFAVEIGLRRVRDLQCTTSFFAYFRECGNEDALLTADLPAFDDDRLQALCMTVKPNGSLASMSSALCDLLQYTPEEVVSTSVARLLPDDVCSTLQCSPETMQAEAGALVELHGTCRKKDGTRTCTVTFKIVPSVLGVGDSSFFCIVIRPELVQERLVQRQAIARAVFSGIVEGAMLVDATTGAILECNGAAASLWLSNSESFVGASAAALFGMTLSMDAPLFRLGAPSICASLDPMARWSR